MSETGRDGTKATKAGGLRAGDLTITVDGKEIPAAGRMEWLDEMVAKGRLTYSRWSILEPKGLGEEVADMLRRLNEQAEAEVQAASLPPLCSAAAMDSCSPSRRAIRAMMAPVLEALHETGWDEAFGILPPERAKGSSPDEPERGGC